MEKRWEMFPKNNDDLKQQLLFNRGIKNSQEVEKFLHPHLNRLEKRNNLFPEIDKAMERIVGAIKNKELIYIYGDYDVDGITGAAILWETIDSLGGEVLPCIPSRRSEGYGLHNDALERLAGQGAKVIVSVDCGITAVEQAELAKKLKVDLIITDHHQPLDKLPKPFALVHTTSLAGSGVAFRLAEALLDAFKIDDEKQYFKNLELATLGTISDMVPLKGDNRVIVKNGLLSLSKTQRIGLQAMYQEALIKNTIGTYEVGFIVSPRLNAMGRLDSAMDSLRILLTRNKERAKTLAQKLGVVNKERQQKTIEVYEDAKKRVEDEFKNSKFLVLSSSEYPEGVVGLAASRLVESFYRPVAVIGKGEKVFKGSARSVNGFNIVEAIHSQASLLVSHGGHPMAAGFSIEEKNIERFRKNLEKLADEKLPDDLLVPVLRIDSELELQQINSELEIILKEFEPFGVGNPEPNFLTKSLEVVEVKSVGKEDKHVKLCLKNKVGDLLICVGFNLNSKRPKMGDLVDIVYNIRANSWNGKKTLEARIKDIRLSELN